MKSILILVMFFSIACGRQTVNTSCRSREYAMRDCVIANTPNYGPEYSVGMCNNMLPYNRCY